MSTIKGLAKTAMVAVVAASVLAPQAAEARSRRYNPWPAIGAGVAVGTLMGMSGARRAYGGVGPAEVTIKRCFNEVRSKIDRRYGIVIPQVRKKCITERGVMTPNGFIRTR